MKRGSIKRFLSTGVVATSLLAAGTAEAASDMFLRLDGVMGESADAKHKGEIDVLAWSWGESTGTARTRRGVAAKACIQDLSLTKFIDSASPALIMNGMTGQVAPNAILVVRKAGQEQLEYLRLTLKNVTITAYQTGGSGGEDRLTENVVLHFDSLQGQYVQQRADGSAGAPITFEITENSLGCR